MSLVTSPGHPSHPYPTLAACRSVSRKQPGLPTTAVLGAGHGGLALAGYLAQMGVPVHLWNRSPGPLQAVLALGGIRLNDALAEPTRVSADLTRTLDGAEVVLVALPANGHREVARICAAHLTDGQAVLLLPGRTGGALEFARELRFHGCTAEVLIGETQTFPLASRMIAPGMARLFGVKHRVPMAALPADRTPELLDRCLPLLPMLTPAGSVLETSFGNMGAILHPVIMLLNASRIEDGAQSFKFYVEGVTPAVAKMLAKADAERCAIAAAYGVVTPTLEEWLAGTYGRREPDLRRALTRNPAYQEILAPTGLRHRYVEEDVPTGLVPLADLGALAGVPCPTLDSLIRLATALNGCDYRAEGRNLTAFGLDGLDPVAIRRMVTQG